MATLASVTPRNQKSGDGKNHFQRIFTSEDLLQAVAPNTKKGVTIVRFIPEVAPDGTILPMVLGRGPGGLDFSHFLIENLIFNAGKNERWTAIAKPSDRPDMDESDFPYSRMFIRLRGQQKSKELDPAYEKEVEALLRKPENKNLPAQLQQTREMVIGQCIVIQLNGKKLEKLKAKQGIFLSVSAVQALNETLENAHKQGIDVFSPAEGRAIIFTPRPQRGSGILMFDTDIGEKLPVSPDQCRKWWVPWDKVIVRHPIKMHFHRLIAGYGRRIVDYVFGGEFVAEALGEEYRQPRAESLAGCSNVTAVGASARSESPQVENTGPSMALDIDDDNSTSIDDDGADDDAVSEVEVRHHSEAGKSGSTVSGPQDAAALAKSFEEQLGGL